MALAAADKDALELLATRVDTVASWFSGGRETEVSQIAADIRKVASGGAGDLVAASAEEEKRQAEIDAANEVLRQQQAEAEAKAAGTTSESS